MEVLAFEMRLWREELFPGKGMSGRDFGTGMGRNSDRFLYTR